MSPDNNATYFHGLLVIFGTVRLSHASLSICLINVVSDIDQSLLQFSPEGTKRGIDLVD